MNALGVQLTPRFVELLEVHIKWNSVFVFVRRVEERGCQRCQRFEFRGMLHNRQPHHLRDVQKGQVVKVRRGLEQFLRPLVQFSTVWQALPPTEHRVEVVDIAENGLGITVVDFRLEVFLEFCGKSESTSPYLFYLHLTRGIRPAEKTTGKYRGVDFRQKVHRNE